MIRPVRDRERFLALPFLERLADADDRREPRADRRQRLAVDDRVALPEQPPPLGMADDHVLRAGFLDHGRRHLARERALALPVEVLRRDADVRVARRVRERMHRGERRREDHLDVGDMS